MKDMQMGTGAASRGRGGEAPPTVRSYTAGEILYRLNFQRRSRAEVHAEERLKAALYCSSCHLLIGTGQSMHLVRVLTGMLGGGLGLVHERCLNGTSPLELADHLDDLRAHLSPPPLPSPTGETAKKPAAREPASPPHQAAVIEKPRFVKRPLRLRWGQL